MISIEPKALAGELASTPGVEAIRSACAAQPTYLVGGAVRDLLLGRPRGELDVATEGDVEALADRLGGAEISHERFATASLVTNGIRVDLARTRTETYDAPGSLPRIEPAPLEADLRRRDFTVNAMALPLHSEPRLIDPHGGYDDLEAGLLRVLHERSFIDDPTRLLRAARYAARLGMELEDRTRELAAEARLDTVSANRVSAELARLAVEPSSERGFELLAELGVLGVDPDGPERVAAVRRLLDDPSWSSLADAAAVVLAAAEGRGLERARELAAARISSPSEGVELARGSDPVELALARALGGEWLDRWLGEWRRVSLDITGDDLLAAGIEPGPAVGRGLAEALKAKLDGRVNGREDELAVALRAARR